MQVRFRERENPFNNCLLNDSEEEEEEEEEEQIDWDEFNAS